MPNAPDMSAVLYLLILQGSIGTYDVIWHHEWKEKLPSRPGSELEQKIHSGREFFYALIFIGLAWFSWNGAYAWLMGGVLLLEILLTAWDFVVEDQTRRLQPSERLAHLFLSINSGAYMALLVPHLLVWSNEETTLAYVNYGLPSWMLCGMGVGVFIWGLRDLYSGFRPKTA